MARARWTSIGMLLAATAYGCSAREAAPAQATHKVSASPAVVAISAPELTALLGRGGHRTIVNVWATWCAPCRRELPALLAVARSHRADGLRLVLISADFPDQQVAVRAFLAAQGVTETTYIKHGEDMAFLSALDPRLTGALPATLVYDASGRKTDFWEGESDSLRFEQAVRGISTTHSDTKEQQP